MKILQEQKKLRTLTVVFTILMILFVFTGCGKTEPQSGKTSNPQMQNAILENYNLNVQVQGKHRMVITETLTINYRNKIDGICRVIPYEGYRFDPVRNEVSQFRMVLDQLDVDAAYSMRKEAGKAYLKIGALEDSKAGGTQIYTLKYRLSCYQDQDDTQDTMLCDLLPYEWEGEIKSASVSLTMPKDFEATGIKLYRYAGGSWINSNVGYTTAGKTITMLLKEKQIAANPQLNMLITLPEGYFKGEKTLLPLQIFFYVLLILLTAGAIVLWWLYGKPMSVQKVSVFSNHKLTPLEDAYLMRRTISITDIAAFLTYWANCGVVRITQSSAKEYTISCLNPPDKAAKNFEFTLYNALFGAEKKTYSVSDAAAIMRNCLPKIKRQTARNCAVLCGGRLYTLESYVVKYGSLFLSVVPTMMVMAIGGHLALDYSAAYVGLISSAVLLVIHGAFLWLKRVWSSLSNKMHAVFTAIYLVVELTVMGGIIYYGTSSLHMNWQLAVMVIATFLILAVCLLTGRMTEGYRLQLAQLQAYKRFLCSTQTVSDDISPYYYENLPRAYVLRIGKMFSKKCDMYLLQEHESMLMRGKTDELSHSTGFYLLYQKFIGSFYRAEFESASNDNTDVPQQDGKVSAEKSTGQRGAGFFSTIMFYIVMGFQKIAHGINLGIDWVQERFHRTR